MTPRALGLGFAACLLVNLVMAYNDFYLQNSLLIGNHFPMIAIALLVALAAGVNPVLRRFTRVPPLAPGELLLVWALIGVSGGVGSAGLMRYLPGWIAQPAYYATGANEWDRQVLRFLPDWMLLSRDAASPAVRGFMEGMKAGERIPWGAWVRPLAAWCVFIAGLWAVLFALCSLLFAQWARHERLIFPIVQVPLAVAGAPAPGRFLNAFLANPVTWAGIAVPGVVLGLNNLRAYAPGLPAIPLTWPMWGFFPDRPWSEFNLQSANLYFSVVGLTFLLTTEIAFSLWACFVAYRASFVYVAWLGAGATGFWGGWGVKISTDEAAGAVFVLAGFVFWSARRTLEGWWKRALAGRDDPDTDLMPPRIAAALLLGGFAAMLAWQVRAGVSWWAALFVIAAFTAVLLVLTRLVAEAGLLFVQTNAVVVDVLTGWVPAAWITGPTLAVLTLHKAVHMHDLREILMPYLMDGLKTCRETAVSARRALGVFAVAAVLTLAISAYGRITTAYKYGGVNMDQWAHVWSNSMWLGGAAHYRKSPPSYEFVRVGDARVLPVHVAHGLLGAAVAGTLLLLRARFAWWPLHPFGMLTVGTYAMNSIWFSILLGWAAKAAVMTFGGAAAYRRVLPFFLGLALGESLVGAVFTLLSLATGVPNLEILPR